MKLKNPEYIKMNNLFDSKLCQFLVFIFILNVVSVNLLYGSNLLQNPKLNPNNNYKLISLIHQKDTQFLLKVDFSQNSTPVQSGFQGYLAEHEVANTFVTQSFQVEENTVSIKINWPAGTVNTAMQMIDRGVNTNQEMNDLLRDWIGTDGRVAKVPMILTLSGLPSGSYEWTSFHHDNNDQTGMFNVKIEDANGTTIKNGIDISNGNLSVNLVTVLKSTIKSDGSDVKLTFEMNSYPDNSTSFFVMNGFTLGLPDSTVSNNPVHPVQSQLTSPLNRLKNVPLNPLLKWSKSNSADSYLVYIDTENPPKRVVNVLETSFATSTLLPNTTYYWQVDALNNIGTTSSEIRSFTTKDSASAGFSGKTIVEFNHSHQFYNEGFNLKLSSNNPEANIIYTLNSSKPSSENGTVYYDEVFIDSTLVVKAIAVSETDTSDVVTNTFLFPESISKQGKSPAGFPQFWGGSSTIAADYEMDPEIVKHPSYAGEISKALQSIPTVSLSMNIDDWFNPNTGVYAGYPNSDISREKPVTAEFLFPDNEENFVVECGVQNQGGTSIVNWKVPKQSMRLLFKEIYGPAKLNYKLFPDAEIESINTLVLDGFLYSWVHPFDEKQRNTTLFFRDQLASDLQNKMGWPSFHGIYVNLFINGLYWGMYDLHERPDEAFLAEYLDASREDFDIIKHNPNNVVQGSNSAYLEMLDFARKGLSTPEALKNIQKYLDLPAFIDYMILNFYLGNFDWAHQNYYAARNKVLKTGFRFYTWDAEHVMRYSDVNFNNTQKNDKGGPTEIHTLLKQNEEYRMMFADAVYRHFFNEGVLTPESFGESFLFRKNEIENAVILESARWGDYMENLSGITYTKNDHWIPEVNKVLEDYIPKRREIVLNQLRYNSPKLFPDYMPPVFMVENQPSNSQKKVELINPNTAEGDIYYTLDGSDPRAQGGAVKGLKYTKAITLKNSAVIKTRFLSKNSGSWSAMAEKPVLFDGFYGTEVVINEIMYHPQNNYPEYVELVNTGETTIVLDGFVFSGGIGYTFQPGSNIFPGTGLVLTNDTALFRNSYGFSAYGQFNKQLSNDAEILILKNRYNQIVDSVFYSDTIPWPLAADGDGYSLELINPLSDNSVYSNWKESDKLNGTPFEPQTGQELRVTLYPNPFDQAVYIEIGNQELAYEPFIVEVFNLFGSKVKSLEISSYNSKIKIPAGDLSQGVYIIQIQSKQNPDFEVQSLKAIKL